MTIAIQKGVALPVVAKRPYKRKLSPLTNEILTTLGECDEGDSFAVAGKPRSIALVAGKMAKKLGIAIRTAPEGDGARVWRVAPKPVAAAAQG